MQERAIKYPLKFRPVFRPAIWGGGRLVAFMDCGTDQLSGIPCGEAIGECWGISAVPGYESVVLNGNLKGMSLSEVTSSYGVELMGEENSKKYGADFPLLVKFIDAAKDLSVQVHPNDRMAAERHGCSGKTEMWYVIDAAEGASLLAGFSSEVVKQEFEKLSGEEIMGLLQKFYIKEGDMFYLPAGKVHSIGAGAFIAEIQQSSDITYRIYDYDRRDASGRTRELHTQQALDAIDFSISGDACKISNIEADTLSDNIWERAVGNVKSEYFTTSMLELRSDGGKARSYDFSYAHLKSFVILTCVGGSMSVVYGNENVMGVKQGDVVLLPADLESVSFELAPYSECRFLETHI